MSTSLNLTPPPLLINPSQILTAYSACVLHGVDLNENIDLTESHTSPIILSTKISYKLHPKGFKLGPKYENAMHGVLSLNCMLTLLAYHPLFSTKKSLASYIFYSVKRNFVSAISEHIQIYPQSAVIFSKKTELEFWVLEHQIRRPFLPQIFFITTAEQTNKIMHGHFICWYCNRTLIKRDEPAQAAGFACGASCGNAMKYAVESSVKSSDRSFWRWKDQPADLHGEGTITEDQDPFSRSCFMEIEKSVAIFLNENYENGTGPTAKHFGIPEYNAENNIEKDLGSVLKVFTGKAPRFNFITSAGITDTKTGYFVYFAPFETGFWMVTLSCSLLCFIVGLMTINFHTAKATKSEVFVEYSNWTVATSFGQYHHAGLPILKPEETQQACSVHLLVVCWLTIITLINGLYQAVFNSDATTLFPYVSRYSELWQLENFRLYIPVNDTEFTSVVMRTDGSNPDRLHIAVCRNSLQTTFPQCHILDSISNTRKYLERTKKQMREGSGATTENFTCKTIMTAKISAAAVFQKLEFGRAQIEQK